MQSFFKEASSLDVEVSIHPAQSPLLCRALLSAEHFCGRNLLKHAHFKPMIGLTNDRDNLLDSKRIFSLGGISWGAYSRSPKTQPKHTKLLA
jgi:hypothetical protein